MKWLGAASNCSFLCGTVEHVQNAIAKTVEITVTIRVAFQNSVFTKRGNIFYSLCSIIMNFVRLMSAAWAEMRLLRQLNDNFCPIW